MDRNSLQKNMLLKRKNGEVQIKGQGDSEIKGNSNGSTEQIFRVLAIADEEILVIDCIKKTMPVWMKIEKLNDFTKEKEINQLGKADFDILEDYSPDVRKTIYQRYNIISAILPFVDNESMRSELIARMAEEYSISKQLVRKYFCEYLSSQDIRSLAPQERNTDRALTQDEKNMRKALNKYFYTTKKRTLKNVYTMMLKDSYLDGEGKLLNVYPSFYQFRYFFRKYNTKQTEYISRNGLSYYQRNQRPLEDLDICWIKVISDSGYRTDLRNEASAKTGRQLAEIPFVRKKMESVSNGKMEKVAKEMAIDHRTLQQTFSGLVFFHFLQSCDKEESEKLTAVMGESFYRLPLI